MQNILKHSLLAGLFGVAVIAAPQGFHAPFTAAIASEMGHNSVIRISASERLPVTKSITVGVGKTTMIELPRNLRDVVVSDPATLDAVVQSANRVYLIGKGIGDANVFLFDENGEQIVTLEVTVQRDAHQLEDVIKRLVPGSNVNAEIMNDNVILTGTVPTPADAARAADLGSRFIAKVGAPPNPGNVINMLRAEGKEQVMLKVTVAEVQREAIKRLGVNWAGGAGGDGAHGFASNNAFPITGADGNDTSLFGVAGSKPGGCLIPHGKGNGILVPASSISGAIGSCLAATLQAFERTGLLRTLAEPTLTAISGETADFLAGGEYPIPTADKNNTITVTYKKFGVSVAFTPLVMAESRISLKVSSEVSELTNDGAVTTTNFAIKALKVRRANTTVELPSGGSMVIAGLISDATRQSIEGLPGLKNLPILGALFQSRDFKKAETELVIIVTPYTVKAVARDQLATPVDGLEDPTDLQADFMGQINKVYGKQEALPEGQYEGKYGFIVE